SQDAERDLAVDRVCAVPASGCRIGRHLSLPSFLPIDSFFSLQAQWYPELELRAGPRLACDVEPAAGELRPLANGDQADVAGQARGFGDDEAFAVVSDFDPYAVLDAIGDDCDPGRASVLLDAGEQLERIVVKRAREAPPRLVATSRDVVEQMTARGHRLLEADRDTPELVFGFLVLPDEARGHANEPEGPQVVGGEAVG